MSGVEERSGDRSITTSRPLDLRARAAEALGLADVDAKLAAVHAMWAEVKAGHCPIDTEAAVPAPLWLPGRPDRPRWVDPSQVPWRTPFTPEGRAALLHAVAHIEFNAINLALDAVWRFPGLPREYYIDWARIADEEALHFALVREHLRSTGHGYGDFDAHGGLWAMVESTAADPLARMALVPRTLEARGLDVTPPMQQKFAKAGDQRAVEILDVILRDEVGHVAAGNRWYRWLCERDGVDPIAHYEVLAKRHRAPRLKGPFNLEARARAGFTGEEMERLRGMG